MFGRPPEGGLLSSCDGVGWTAAKCSGVFQRWAEHERRLLAVRRLRWAAQHSAKMRYCCVEGVADSLLKLACWAPSTCASAESPESRPSCSPKNSHCYFLPSSRAPMVGVSVAIVCRTFGPWSCATNRYCEPCLKPHLKPRLKPLCKPMPPCFPVLPLSRLSCRLRFFAGEKRGGFCQKSGGFHQTSAL